MLRAWIICVIAEVASSWVGNLRNCEVRCQCNSESGDGDQAGKYYRGTVAVPALASTTAMAVNAQSMLDEIHSESLQRVCIAPYSFLFHIIQSDPLVTHVCPCRK